jgi:two-component sensor histidine kinase
MPILQAMVDQLEGTLSIDGSQGVKVRIQFPLIQA